MKKSEYKDLAALRRDLEALLDEIRGGRFLATYGTIGDCLQKHPSARLPEIVTLRRQVCFTPEIGPSPADYVKMLLGATIDLLADSDDPDLDDDPLTTLEHRLCKAIKEGIECGYNKPFDKHSSPQVTYDRGQFNAYNRVLQWIKDLTEEE